MTALVFDRDKVDEVDDWAQSVGHLGRSAILWVDVDTPDDHEAERLAERLELDGESVDRLARRHDRPYFRDHAEYLHATVYAPAHDGRSADLEQIDCLVAKHWILTVHEQPVEVLERFRDRASGSGDTGRLDGLEFLADLIEWVLGSYLAAFEDVEQALEEFDARAMAGELEIPSPSSAVSSNSGGRSGGFAEHSSPTASCCWRSPGRSSRRSRARPMPNASRISEVVWRTSHQSARDSRATPWSARSTSMPQGAPDERDHEGPHARVAPPASRGR